MVGILRYMTGLYFGPPLGKGVIQDLEYAMRTNGGLTQEEDKKLQDFNAGPSAVFVVFLGFGSFVVWFGLSLGYGYIMGKSMYRGTFRVSPVVLLKEAEGRMKMELANIILTKHGDDEFLVEAVKKHFFAEHLFDDLHQDQPLFRWHPHHSYTDIVFVERMNEIEATNSYDEARTVSGGTTADNGPSGDLMEDPFACILDSPGDVESNNPPGNISTVLKRSELRARRRSHRHHHRRHADDKFAAL
ncbi:uncharacterized protein LOC120692751 isoform X2 [Panicum virgatum]|uniref:uncharacterized protein LOC120692751 isoform X2 n=1 Tax=Panicum virgatum TaxID=38727 RepID=UPI0019D5F24C|nr:uncharacterized protein LOC120692751 isoform X2 [Panicum virgatum]